MDSCMTEMTQSTDAFKMFHHLCSKKAEKGHFSCFTLPQVLFWHTC